MKRLSKAAIVTTALAATMLVPAGASATDFTGGAASTAAGSTTKTFRCGGDKAACERKQEELRPNNTVGPIGYQPPSTTGRGNYFYFNYTPK